MPQIPYNPIPDRAPKDIATPYISLNTPGAAFGESIAQSKGPAGQAFGNLGSALEKSGNELFARAMAIQQLRNETEAKDADTTYIATAGRMRADFNSLQGKAAVDAGGKYMQDLEDTRAKIRDGL